MLGEKKTYDGGVNWEWWKGADRKQQVTEKLEVNVSEKTIGDE